MAQLQNILKTDKSWKIQSQQIQDNWMIKTTFNPLEEIKEETGNPVTLTSKWVQVTAPKVETKIPWSAWLIKTEFNKKVDVPVYWSETNVTPKIQTEQTKVTSPTQVSPTDLQKWVSTWIYTKNQSWQYLDSKTWQVVTPTWTRTDVFDTSWDWVIQPTELTWEYKSFYDSLTDIEKKQFAAIWENARKQGQDVAKAYANYMRDFNTAKTRAELDEANRLKLEWIVEEANVIQESQTLRKAKQSINKLKQSVAYLWTWWVPWKSQTALNWVQNQIKEGNTTYQELVKLQWLAKSARAMWYESKALKYEQQMEDLNTKLNDDIDKTIQWAFNSLIEADNNWKLDTLEEIEAFRVKMLTDLDSSITGIADANIAQRQYLIERFDNIVKEEQTKAKNKWVVNKEMSMVQGFYVDWNWDPIISSTTGKRIEIPAEAPIDPVFDAKTGRLITFTTDANWQIQANVDQVIDSPTFEEQTIQNYAKLFANGKLDIWDLQGMWLWQELITDIISQSAWITPTPAEMTPIQKAQYDLDLKKFWFEVAKFNLENKGATTWEAIVQTNPQSIVDFSTSKRWRTNLQCWEFTNDYIQQVTWTKWWMWDTWESKVNAINNIWVSDEPQVWWVFIYNKWWSKVWHTWIIQSVNPDWSITTLEANRAGSKTWWPAEQVTYSAETLKKWFTFSDKISEPLTWLTKTQKADLKTARTDMESDPQYKAYRTLANQVKDLEWIRKRISSWKDTPQDQIQIITSFAKVLDPTSVVREAEFEINKKYWQSWVESALQSAKHYWDWSWVLTEKWRKILAESLSNRYNSINSEYNQVLRSAKDNIEFNLWRPISDKEFETLTQTKFIKEPVKAETTIKTDIKAPIKNRIAEIRKAKWK